MSATRKYNVSGRRARAEATRQRVLETATALFVSHGYDGVSIREIATQAEVSPDLIYHAFGNKVGLLARVLDVAVVGDDEPVAFRDRPWITALTELPFDERFAAVIDHGCDVAARAAPVMRVLRAATVSEPEIAAMVARAEAARRDDMAHLLAVVGTGLDAPFVEPHDAAIDWFAALAGDGLYLELVHDRGWPPDRYRAWLARSLRAAIVR